jgi:hydrogenase nickel incorporation protein HypA/HybF
MHELTLAMNLLEIAEEELSRSGSAHVVSIDVEAGKLSGVDTDALSFAFSVSVRGSVMAETKLNISEKRGTGYCSICLAEFEMNTIFDVCPHCDRPASKIVDGDRLRIISMNVM